MNQNNLCWLKKKYKNENLRSSKCSETLQLESLKEKSNIWKAQDSLLYWEYWFSCHLNVYSTLIWYNRETFQVESSSASCLVSVQWGGGLQIIKTARIDWKISCAGKDCLVVEGKASWSPFSPASKYFASHGTVLHSMAVSQEQWERHWLYWMASC